MYLGHKMGCRRNEPTPPAVICSPVHLFKVIFAKGKDGVASPAPKTDLIEE